MMRTIKKAGKTILHEWQGYLLAIFLVILATWLKILAEPNIIPANVPILYLLAIVPTAMFFGLGPSILVCILSLLAFDFFFMPPLYQLAPNDVVDAPVLVIFLIVGILFSILSSNLRRKNLIATREINARKQAEKELLKHQEQLEEMVKQRTAELETANTGLKQENAIRRQTEEALRQSEQRWATTLASIGDAVIATDIDGKIVFMNSAAEALTGWDLREASFRPIGEVFNIVNEQTRQKVENPVDKVLKEGAICGLANHTILLRKNGVEFPIDDSGAPILDPERKATGVVLVFRDITERRQAEYAQAKSKEELEVKVKERTAELDQVYQQLKQYANKITQVQEEERKRIAYELHDDTAQYLSILKMQIGALAESEEIQSPKIKERLQFLERDADRAFNDVRRYSHELRPVVLEHQGLVAALEQIADDYNTLGELFVGVTIEGTEPELSEETKLGFFRIAQEALNNTRKHAKASKVDIDIRFNQGRIQMTVSDNGIGFDTKETPKKIGDKGSLGLMSMNERAALINADLKITSKPGKGTQIIVKGFCA